MARQRHQHPSDLVNGLSHIPAADLYRRIAALRRRYDRSLTFNQIYERVRRLIDAYAILIIPVQLNGVYRVRTNIGRTLFRSAKELWYPPRDVIAGYGRFNLPHESIFYANNTSHGALSEVRANVGDWVTLMSCHTKERFTELRCAHIGLERSLAPELRRAQEVALPRVNEAFLAQFRNKTIHKRWLMIDDALANLVTSSFDSEDEEHGYKITSALGKLLFKADEIDAINYPSIATNFNSINICIRPEIADGRFKPSECWTISIDDVVNQLPGSDRSDGPFYKSSFLRRSINTAEDGSITWSEELENVQVEDIEHLAWRPMVT